LNVTAPGNGGGQIHRPGPLHRRWTRLYPNDPSSRELNSIFCFSPAFGFAFLRFFSQLHFLRFFSTRKKLFAATSRPTDPLPPVPFNHSYQTPTLPINNQSRSCLLTKATQMNEMDKVDVLVATPLRLKGLVEKARIDLGFVRFLILDEGTYCIS
jgi:hypothetical protein